MAATTAEILDKVGKLVSLANSEGNEEEARTAGMLALRLMKENKLVLVPQSEIDRIKKVIGESQALVKKYEGDANQKMMLGALAGFLFAKQGI
jgi:Protein of unknown function (DUF2786)